MRSKEQSRRQNPACVDAVPTGMAANEKNVCAHHDRTPRHHPSSGIDGARVTGRG